MENRWQREIELLLKELTLDEKIAMIHGNGLFCTGGVERLSIPPLYLSDGPMGVRGEFLNDKWIPAENRADEVTYCLSNSAVAATWNRKLAREAGQVLGEEARGRGKDVILAPGVNHKRTPLCGRNFEYFSEDPYLTAQLAVPVIRGIQESDVAACVKHFAMNNQETERLYVNVEAEERTIRELYLPAFEAAVKEGESLSVMGAYNLIRGHHCCQHPELLQKILREELSYDGLIVSDWGGVHDTKEAAESALDVEMSVTDDFDDYCMAQPLKKAVLSGEVKEACVDEKVRHILLLMCRLRMIDIVASKGKDGTETVSVRPGKGRKTGSYNTPEHREKVLRAAEESIVLLKNEEGKLPLKEEKRKKVLVIGDNAVRRQALGGGSAEIKALYEITPLMGLKMELGGNCQIDYVAGYYVPEKEETDHNWQEDSLKGEEEGARSEEDAASGKKAALQEKQRLLREEAVSLADSYDEVIFVGGLNHGQDVEGQDRESLMLPYAQEELLMALLDRREDMVIVLLAGSPVDVSSFAGRAKALVLMSYSGMEGGRALARVLLGKVNPSGKLAETWVEKLSDYGFSKEMFPGRELTEEEKKRMNAHLTENYREGIFSGYRYFDRKKKPVAFCFGHGLSYTDFIYEKMTVERKEKQEGKGFVLTVKVTVRNTGRVAGKETVQLYLGEETVSPENPVKELKGFEKLSLQPGETGEAVMYLTEKDFTHYQEKGRGWYIRSGRYLLSAAASLQDIRLQTGIDIPEEMGNYFI